MASYKSSPPSGSVDRALPRDFTDHGPCVEELAIEFARRDAAVAEALIETLVAQAIRQWRLDDATFWQRVKFHARLIRATARHTSRPDVPTDVTPQR